VVRFHPGKCRNIEKQRYRQEAKAPEFDSGNVGSNPAIGKLIFTNVLRQINLCMVKSFLDWLLFSTNNLHDNKRIAVTYLYKRFNRDPSGNSFLLSSFPTPFAGLLRERTTRSAQKALLRSSSGMKQANKILPAQRDRYSQLALPFVKNSDLFVSIDTQPFYDSRFSLRVLEELFYMSSFNFNDLHKILLNKLVKDSLGIRQIRHRVPCHVPFIYYYGYRALLRARYTGAQLSSRLVMFNTFSYGRMAQFPRPMPRLGFLIDSLNSKAFKNVRGYIILAKLFSQVKAFKFRQFFPPQYLFLLFERPKRIFRKNIALVSATNPLSLSYVKTPSFIRPMKELMHSKPVHNTSIYKGFTFGSFFNRLNTSLYNIYVNQDSKSVLKLLLSTFGRFLRYGNPSVLARKLSRKPRLKRRINRIYTRNLLKQYSKPIKLRRRKKSTLLSKIEKVVKEFRTFGLSRINHNVLPKLLVPALRPQKSKRYIKPFSKWEKIETLKKVKAEEVKPIKKKFVWWGGKGDPAKRKSSQTTKAKPHITKHLEVRIRKWIAFLNKNRRLREIYIRLAKKLPKEMPEKPKKPPRTNNWLFNFLKFFGQNKKKVRRKPLKVQLKYNSSLKRLTKVKPSTLYKSQAIRRWNWNRHRRNTLRTNIRMWKRHFGPKIDTNSFIEYLKQMAKTLEMLKRPIPNMAKTLERPINIKRNIRLISTRVVKVLKQLFDKSKKKKYIVNRKYIGLRKQVSVAAKLYNEFGEYIAPNLVVTNTKLIYIQKLLRQPYFGHKFPTFKRSLQTKALLSRISPPKAKDKEPKIAPKKYLQKSTIPFDNPLKKLPPPKNPNKKQSFQNVPFPKKYPTQNPDKKVLVQPTFVPKPVISQKPYFKPAPNTVLSKQTSNTFDRIREERAATYRRENPFKKPL
jgi:hypothetical protein